MKFTATTTSKGQLTIPQIVRLKLGLKQGTRVDIYPTDNGFIGKLRRKSKILEFSGDLKKFDKGESLRSIREQAQANAARYISNRTSK